MGGNDPQWEAEATARRIQIRIVSAPSEDPDTNMLLEALESVQVSTYGSRDREPVSQHDFFPPSGMFIVGYNVDEQPVACGGYRLRSDIRHGEIDAEIKRMYVVSDARRQGYGKQILNALETAARKSSYQVSGAGRLVGVMGGLV